MQLNLQRNAAWSAFEALASAVVLFFLYRLIVLQLGIQSVGIWSLVLATTSLIRVADFGAATGLSRFVAISSKTDRTQARRYIDTALFINFGLYAALAVLFYVPADYGLSISIKDPSSLRLGRELLPYALTSFVLSNLAAATTATLVGLHRSDLKSAIIICGVLVQATSSFVLISMDGLIGIGKAQILQNCFVIAAGSLFSYKVLYQKLGLLIPTKISRRALKDLLGLGVKLQLTGLITFLLDPTVKFLMSSFGGLEQTGLYEIANRLVLQTRAIIVAPTQTLVPAFAFTKENSPETLASLYSKSVSLTCLVGTIAIGGVIILSPLVSFLLFGHFVFTFVLFVVLLGCGWLGNLLAAPAYLLGVGTAQLRWNAAGNLLTLAITLIAGVALGKALAGPGIALASATAQAIGSFLTMIMNCRQEHVRAFPRFEEMRATFVSRVLVAYSSLRKAGADRGAR